MAAAEEAFPVIVHFAVAEQHNGGYYGSHFGGHFNGPYGHYGHHSHYGSHHPGEYGRRRGTHFWSHRYGRAIPDDLLRTENRNVKYYWGNYGGVSQLPLR